jgi:hypothetical protein
MNRPAKSVIALITVVVVVAAWIGLVAFYLLAKPAIGQWAIAVTVVALITEGAMWVGAALIGATVLQKRREIWGAIVQAARRTLTGSGT